MSITNTYALALIAVSCIRRCDLLTRAVVRVDYARARAAAKGDGILVPRYRVAVKEPDIESMGPRIFFSGPSTTILPHSNEPAMPVSSARVSVTVHSPADEAITLTSGPTPTCTTIGIAAVVLN